MPRKKFRPIPPINPESLAKFWQHITVLNGDRCWLWSGRTAPGGYGIFSIGRLYYRASRIMVFIVTGSDPGPLWALHSCDNPPCVSPFHLFIGNHIDNMNDAVHKGRMASGQNHGLRRHPERAARGERHGGCKLTAAQVLEIRSRTGTEVNLAEEFGISRSMVGLIRRRGKWAHI